MYIDMDEYVIKSDAHNWSLYEKRAKGSKMEEGEDAEEVEETEAGIRLVPRGYFPRLRDAVLKMIDVSMKNAGEVVTLEEVLAKLSEVEQKLMKLADGIQPESIRPSTQREARSDDENDNPGGLYKLPGKILEVVPDIKVISSKSKGRGVTLMCEVDDVDGLADVIRDKMQKLEGPLYQVCKLTLERLGA